MSKASNGANLQAPLLAWVKVETTGSDPRLDYILEVALIITKADRDLTEMTGISLVVQPDGSRWRSRLDDSSLAKVHRRSGLTSDISHGVSSREAQVALDQTLKRCGEPQDYMLAGMGVGSFDRDFISATWSRLDSWWRFGTYDVETFRHMLRMTDNEDLIWSTTSRKRKVRAMDVLQRTVQEARHYQALQVTASEDS